MLIDLHHAESALRSLVDLIDRVGVYEQPSGSIEPCGLFADSDGAAVLGQAYVAACTALGRKPVWGAAGKAA